jgi:hypothetical protein
MAPLLMAPIPIKAGSGPDTLKAQPTAMVSGDRNGRGDDKSGARVRLKGEDKLLP